MLFPIAVLLTMEVVAAGGSDERTLPAAGETDPVQTIAAVARTILGRVGVKEAQKAVRVEMFREALRLVGGNRHAAARLLRVDRRYVLKMLKEISDL